MRIPTVSQVGLLLAYADSTRVSTRHGFRPYIASGAFAGLRKGEAAGVQVGDIDVVRRRLTLSRQLQCDGATFAVRLPKYGSERVVHLPDDLVERLGSHIDTFWPDKAPDLWLFTDGGGQDAGCRLGVDSAGPTGEPIDHVAMYESSMHLQR